MAVKITEHANGLIVDYGDNVRIERTHAHVRKEPALDEAGKPKLTAIKQPIHDHVPHVDDKGAPVTDDKGELAYMWNVYQRKPNEPFSVEGKPAVSAQGEPLHVHGHHGVLTSETHTWMHVFEGTEAEARAKAAELAG
jgi:hypothetical protein